MYRVNEEVANSGRSGLSDTALIKVTEVKYKSNTLNESN